MNRRQFLKTTAAVTAVTLGATRSPAVVGAVEPVDRSSACEMSLADPRAPLVDQETFAQIAELELRQALRLQYYVSALVMQIETNEAELPKRSSAYLAFAEAMRGKIRGTDVLSVKASDPCVQVLLVGAHLHDLPSIIGRVAAVVQGHRVRVGGACFPTTARDKAELLRQAESLLIAPLSKAAEVSRSLRRSAARRHRAGFDLNARRSPGHVSASPT
jgi:TAT (twin-arginine translocation) pathway signal sequence